MIKISDSPIYTINVYEGSVLFNNKEYRFTIDSGDSYVEVKWDSIQYTPDYPKLLDMESQILEEFEKMMWDES